MGRRSPLPAFCKLLKIGTTIRLPITNSPGSVSQSSLKTKNLPVPSEEEDGDAHIVVGKCNNHNSHEIPRPVQHQRWNSDRSTTSTASVSTVASMCPFGPEDYDDETTEELLHHGEVMGPEESVVVSDQDDGNTTNNNNNDKSSTIPDAVNTLTSCPSATKHVHFGTAEIRVYPQVLGDHPYCSQGCPLELGWEYERQETIPMHDEEEAAAVAAAAASSGVPCCSAWCYKFTPEERLAILAPKYSIAEVRKACRRQARSFELRHKQQQLRLQEFFFTGTGKKPARPLNTR